MKKFYPLSIAVLLFIFGISLKSNAAIHAVQIAPGGQPVFSPNTITMCVGDTILFGMASNTTHNVHILTPVDSTSLTMNTAGQFFGYVPTSAGLYSYQCDFHAGMGMTGTFTVNTSPTAVVNSVTDVDCFGNNTGAIDINVIGGSLTYLWSNSATTQDVSALAAGTYSVVVTNTCGTDTITGIIVNAPTGIVANISGTDVTCNGDADGAADLTVSGGTPSYTFLWSNAATTEDITGLSGGTYSVTVTDANGCTASASIVINEPTAISIPVSLNLPSCNGDCDGSITAAPTGGTGAYTYMWMPGMATTASITGLCADTYTVDVTDASGCSASSAVVLNEPGVLSATIAPFDASCNGGNNGSMDLTVAGGTSPFTFAWSNAATTEDISGLTAGTYSVLVTDANGCTTTASAGISQPSTALSATTDSTFHVTCNGGNDGAIYITVVGGTPPYDYLWSSGQTTLDITGLTAGTYTGTTTDDNGCTITGTVTITEPAAVTITIDSILNANSCSSADGEIYTSSTGGTGMHTYMWSPGLGAADDTIGVAAGSYTLTVTDSSGCMASVTAVVQSTGAITLLVDSVFDASCSNSNDGEIYTSLSGGTGPFTYMWTPGTGASDDTLGVSAGIYTLLVTDASGCTATATDTVNAPAALTATVTTKTNVTCNGGSNGSIDISVSGGSGTYAYIWSNGASTQDVSGLIAGTYSVQVIDVICSQTVTLSTNITQPLFGITTAVSGFPENPCGSNSGMAIALVIGGTSPYSYNWSNGQTAQNATGLAAGNYTLTVTDANGCTGTGTVSITCLPVSVAGNNSGIENISVFPNPSSGQFTLEFFAPSSDNITVEIINSIGQNIYTEEVKNFSGSYSHKMDLTHFGKGIYLLRIKGNSGISLRKIMVQ